MSVVIVLMLIGQIIGIFSPYLYGQSVNAVLHHNVRMVIITLVGAFGLSLVQNEFLSWYRERIELTQLDEHIEHHLASKSLEKMFSFSIGQHVNEHSGVRQSIVSRGQSALNEILSNMLYIVIPNVLQIIAILAILCFFKWQIALVSLVFIVLYVALRYRMNNTFLPSALNIRRKRQAMGRLQSEFFRNSTLVISEAQEGRSVEDFDHEGEEYLDYNNSNWLKYMRQFYILYPVLFVGQYASLAVGIYFIFNGDLTTGMFVTLYAWTSTIFSNIQQIMRMQRRMLAQVLDVRKLYDLLDIVPDIDVNSGGERLAVLKGSIEFKSVAFAYPYRHASSEEEREDAQSEIREERVVSDVSFVIPPNAKVGFVGPSGSGKSTIINLIRRHYDPTEGAILIDGVELKNLDLNWFRNQIGNVEQKIELFDRSIRDNILFGLPKGATVSEEQLARAVKDSSLDEFIAKLPEGLDTHIGENGIKVSGGERQRIGIARAFIKDPKILIFDEATSALDSINEKLIHEAINRGAEGRTTIIIAHRLSTVSDADIIFVVAGGKIVDSGKHEELLARSADYQKLIKNQIF